MRVDLGPIGARIPDAGFRNRFLHEHRTAVNWAPRLLGPAPTVLDFGCGQGIGALGMAAHLPLAQVHGVDLGSEYELLGKLSEANLGLPLPANLHLRRVDGRTLPFPDAYFDVVYSWSVFEHVRRDAIPGALAELRRVLRPDGELFVQIDPLYYSARGAHLYGTCPEPWVHLIEQHDVLRERVMSGAGPLASREALWQQYETLNRLTVGDLRAAIGAAGFIVERIESFESPEPPPPRLLSVYQRDVLVTSAVNLLARPARSS
jgi:SAM-dependent methyltransferase